MDKSKNQKLALRNETSLVNVSNQIATTDKILKSIRDKQLSILSAFTDPRDGNVYKTVKIGEQVWMAENLRYIPHVCSCKDQGGIWVYGYEGHDINKAKMTENYKTYGCLYDWIIAKSIAPAGWHLPTDEEWTILINYLGGSRIAGGKLKKAGIQNSYFAQKKITNESGFSAIPGGSRSRSWPKDEFSVIGSMGYWWSSTVAYDYHNPSDPFEKDAWCRIMKYEYDYIYVTRASCRKYEGFSVRCIKDYDDIKKNVIPQREFLDYKDWYYLKIYPTFMEVTVEIRLQKRVDINKKFPNASFALKDLEERRYILDIFNEKRENMRFFNSEEEYYKFMSDQGFITDKDCNDWYKKVVFMINSDSYNDDLVSSIEFLKKVAQKNLG